MLPGVTPALSPHPLVERDANTEAGWDVALVVVVESYDTVERDFVTEALDVAKDEVFVMSSIDEKQMDGRRDLELDEGVVAVALDERR